MAFDALMPQTEQGIPSLWIRSSNYSSMISFIEIFLPDIGKNSKRKTKGSQNLFPERGTKAEKQRNARASRNQVGVLLALLFFHS